MHCHQSRLLLCVIPCRTPAQLVHFLSSSTCFLAGSTRSPPCLSTHSPPSLSTHSPPSLSTHSPPGLSTHSPPCWEIHSLSGFTSRISIWSSSWLARSRQVTQSQLNQHGPIMSYIENNPNNKLLPQPPIQTIKASSTSLSLLYSSLT